MGHQPASVESRKACVQYVTTKVLHDSHFNWREPNATTVMKESDLDFLVF